MPGLYNEIWRKERSNIVEGLSKVLSKLGIEHGVRFERLRFYKEGVSVMWTVSIRKGSLPKLAELPFESSKWRRIANKWRK